MSERITPTAEEISLQANDFEKLNVDLDAVRNIEQIIYEFKSAYKESNPTEAEYKNAIEDIFRKVKDISDKVRDFEMSLPAEGDKITAEELAELFANLDSWSTDLKEHAHQIQEATIAYNERVSALESQNADVDSEVVPESDVTVAPVSAENDEVAKSDGDSTATVSAPDPAPVAPSPAPAPKTASVKKTVYSTKDKEVPEVNIEQLKEQLLGGDLAFYKNANGKYKNKAELGKAFGDVFRYHNVSKKLGDEFFDNQFEHIFPQIDRARTSKEFDIVNELRELMLEKALEVIAADQVADIPVDNEAPLERGVSEVEADVTAQKERLADLEKRFGHDAAFASSDNYKIAKERIDQIDSVQTSDPNSASKQKDKYLSSLEVALDKLTLESNSLIEDVEIKKEILEPSPSDADGGEKYPTPGENLSTPSAFDDEPFEQNVPEWFATESHGTEVDSTKVSAEEKKIVIDIPLEGESAPVAATAKDSALVERYQNARGVWREASRAHGAKEAEYQAALKDFYNGDNWKAKLRVGLFSAASAIGLKPNLPPAVAALEAEYKSTRQAYAEALAVVLAGRGELGNVGLGEDPAKAKAAFADKYIINPQQELLKLQEYSLLRPETREKVKNAMGFLAKHKWHTRVGMVAAAGVVGGLTGGVGLAAAGASWQVWKMAAGTVASLGAAKVAKMATDRRVEMANVEAGINTRDTKKNFNLDDLDSLASGYARTQKEVKDAEKFQKKAVFGAAIAAGGATGVALGQVPEGFVSVTSEDVVVSPFARDIALPYSGREGGFEHVISDLNLGEDFNAAALTSEQTAQIESFLRIKITDYLDANVNMSEAKLEQNLYSVLERKFGNEPWWLEANIRKVDIGEIVLRPVGAAISAEAPLNVMPNLSPLDNDVNPSTEAVSGEVYEVVKGDTLGEIMLDKFKLQFSGFDGAEKQELLNRVFAKLESDPDLARQAGFIRSGNFDADLIYPEDNINMSVMQDLIDREGERMAVLENFQKSAPLPVEVEADVKSVPITVVEKPVVAPSEVNFEGRTYTEAAPAEMARVPEKPSAPVAPKITPLNGQYLDHPAYKDYLTKVFGSEDQALREVLKSAKAFDASTYDVFDGMKGYESPYTLLGDMKMKDYVEFTKQSPVEIRAFLTENNIKYETYLAWVGKINELKASLPANENTRIGDLFGREVALEAAKKLQK